MHVDEIRESFWPWFAFVITKNLRSTNATLTFSQALTPSEWWSYLSLLVVSEEYTLDNILYIEIIVCLGKLCIV